MITFNLNRLKGERIARGISVSEMAEKMGMSQGTYSKKETGKLRLNVDDLSKAIQILDIPESDLGIFFNRQVAKKETI